MKKTGLFLVSYEITTGLAGAPAFLAHLVVNTPAKSVTGQGQIKNGSVHPPLEINTRLEGDFTYMTVMPKETHILVVATGYPVIQWPPHGGIGPVILPNAKLRMVLEDDWQTGTANFSYMDAKGEWHEISGAKVTVADKVSVN